MGTPIKKTRYKLLVLDIDGTLLNRNGEISEEDCRALAAVREVGISVSLCTGRTVRSCRKILEKLSLNGYHIFFDGALVYNPERNEEVYSRPLPPSLVREMSQAALQDGIPLDLFSVTGYFTTEETWRTRIRREFFGIESTICDIRSLWQKEKIIKGGTVISCAAEERNFQAYIRRFKDTLNYTRTVTPAWPDLSFINILAPGVSKGQALEALASHLKIRTDEVMSIGDGSNDIPLLAASGLAVAMQNAPEELKSVADFITADVEQSGVAQAIQKFLLETT